MVDVALHLERLVHGILDLLQQGKVVVSTGTLIISTDAQAKLDQAVNASSDVRQLIKVEAR
eukprot:1262861-Heterocapsa_arctica.AAC.1